MSTDPSLIMFWIVIITLLILTVLYFVLPTRTQFYYAKGKPKRRYLGSIAESAQGTFVSKNELVALNCAAIILHVLSGAAGIMAARSGNPAVTVYAPLFEFLSASGGSAFIKQIPKSIFTVHILTPPIAIEFVTVFFHCIYLVALLDPSVDQWIRQIFDTPSANPLRWFEYSITATLMAAYGSISIGITDFYYFLRGLFSGVALQSLGYGIEILGGARDANEGVIERLKELGAPSSIVESLDKSKATLHRIFFIMFTVVGQLINLPMVAILLYQTFGSKTHSDFWYFLQNAFPLAIWFQTFGIIAQLSYSRWRQFADINFAERYYILLSISTKLAVFWISFGTFKQITEDNQFATKSGVDWRAVRYSAMFVPAAVVIAYAVRDAVVWKRL